MRQLPLPCAVRWSAPCRPWRSGEEVSLIGDAWRILHELATDDKWQGTQIAYVSRTDEPREWQAGELVAQQTRQGCEGLLV